jgi:hypothetical protein
MDVRQSRRHFTRFAVDPQRDGCTPRFGRAVPAAGTATPRVCDEAANPRDSRDRVRGPPRAQCAVMLLVDGNNVSAARRPWHRDSWDGQRRLVLDVARLTQHWDSCADVVFDGGPRADLGPFEGGVRVWFSRRRSADDVIVELAREVPPGEAIVATFDRELARRVRAAHGWAISGETLRVALDRVCGAFHRREPAPPALAEGPAGLLALETVTAKQALRGRRTPPLGAGSALSAHGPEK